MFQERLMKRFSPTDFVTVQNVDNEPYMWQYMPAEKEHIEMVDGIQRNTFRDAPELWVIEPGQTEVIVGGNAYVMIEGLYKKLVAKKNFDNEGLEVDPLTGNYPQHQAINFSFSDGGQQEKWINRIFIGKATPTFTSVSNPLEDLGISDATTPRETVVASSSSKK